MRSLNHLKFLNRNRHTSEYETFLYMKRRHASEWCFTSFEEFYDAVGGVRPKGKVLRRHDEAKPFAHGNIYWGKDNRGLAGAAKSKGRNVRHGLSHSREHEAWRNANQRCNNERHRGHPSYGAKGVRVVFTSFEEFTECLGKRPQGFSLDRANPFGNYSPVNTRWAHDRLQQFNTRACPLNLLYAVIFETLTQDEGMTAEQAAALSTPIPELERAKIRIVG